METHYISRIRIAGEAGRAFITKVAYLTLIGGVALVFSGLLHKISVGLPPMFIASFGGVWLASMIYLALKD